MSSNRPTPPDSQQPPPYSAPVASAAAETNFGFPPGYFIIKSVANGRLLDVEHDNVDDGADIILWPEKESSLVEGECWLALSHMDAKYLASSSGFRKLEADNQVFFIDTSGALCSRLSGHAIDVEGDRLIQRHRRPVSYPYPNAFSHPLPQFWYSSSSRQIFVRFLCDPSYPSLDPDVPPPTAWRQRSYLLSSVPQRKPRSLLENASEVFNNVIASPLAPLASIFGAAPKTTAEEVFNSDIDLREDEVLEEDRGEGEEADDSPEPLRRVAVIAVPEGEQSVTEATQRRRAWEVIPLRRSRAQYAR